MKYINHYLIVIVLLVAFNILTNPRISSSFDGTEWIQNFLLSLNFFTVVTIGFISYTWKSKNGFLWGVITLVLSVIIEALFIMNLSISDKSGISLVSYLITFVVMMFILLILPSCKKCPNCAELVKKEAKLCKFCNSVITS